MKRFVSVLSLVASVWLFGCSDDDDDGTPGPGGPSGDPTLPASWGGTWESTTTPTFGRGGPVDISVDVLCGGESLFDAIELVETDLFDDVECTGTIDETSMDVTCTGTATFSLPLRGEPCVFTFTARLVGTRSGDTLTGTLTETETFTGPCGRQGGTSTYAVTATRLDTGQVGCGSGFSDIVAPEWQGIFATDFTPVPLVSGIEGGPTPIPVDLFLCPGWDVETFLVQSFLSTRRDDGLGFYEVTYSGGFTATTAEIQASVSQTPFGRGVCEDMVTVIRVDLTRSGENVSGTVSFEDRNYPSGCDVNLTEAYTVSGARVSATCTPPTVRSGTGGS